MDEYPVSEGDKVCHARDPEMTGVVTHLDRNIPHPTTCRVRWDGDDYEDIQWTNKLLRVDA